MCVIPCHHVHFKSHFACIQCALHNYGLSRVEQIYIHAYGVGLWHAMTRAQAPLIDMETLNEKCKLQVE